MFKLVSLLVAFSGFDLLFGQECRLMLEPDLQTVLVTKGNDISIVCNASCYGPLTSNQISWFDRHNRRVPSGGRVFSVSYNRGMYSRLILLNADVQDMGRYACAGRIGNEVVRKGINLNVIDRDAHIVEFVVEEEGPRRGDVRIDEPHLPNRRPVRDVQLRDILRRVRREEPSSSNSTEDTSANTSTETSSSSTVDDTYASSVVPWSTPEMTTTINTETSINTVTANNTNTASNRNNDTSNSPQVFDTSVTDGSGDESTSTTSVTAMYTSTKDGVKQRKVKTEEQTSASSPTSTPTSKSTPKSPSKSPLGGRSGKSEEDEDGDGEETTTTVVHGPEARTAFGRYGVLAFALALSAAILLLYTLILLNVILPRCCWKKRSVSFKDEAANKPKETGPSAVDFVALKPLNVESCPNSPDHGFTTVDLDDKPDGAKQDEKQNGTPASPSSSTEPQSPSKFVTTFTIGRKPSTTDPSGVYIHEGKQGEIVSALPEEGAAADTEDGQKSAKSADDHKADDIFASSDAKKDVENDLDTSKEADTSTDSNTDTSGS